MSLSGEIVAAAFAEGPIKATSSDAHVLTSLGINHSNAPHRLRLHEHSGCLVMPFSDGLLFFDPFDPEELSDLVQARTTLTLPEALSAGYTAAPFRHAITGCSSVRGVALSDGDEVFPWADMVQRWPNGGISDRTGIHHSTLLVSPSSSVAEQQRQVVKITNAVLGPATFLPSSSDIFVVAVENASRRVAMFRVHADFMASAHLFDWPAAADRDADGNLDMPQDVALVHVSGTDEWLCAIAGGPRQNIVILDLGSLTLLYTLPSQSWTWGITARMIPAEENRFVVIGVTDQACLSFIFDRADPSVTPKALPLACPSHNQGSHFNTSANFDISGALVLRPTDHSIAVFCPSADDVGTWTEQGSVTLENSISTGQICGVCADSRRGRFYVQMTQANLLVFALSGMGSFTKSAFKR